MDERRAIKALLKPQNQGNGRQEINAT